MKIAFEANVLTFPHTGIAKSLIHLIRHIKDAEVILFTSNGRKIDIGFECIRLDSGGGSQNLAPLASCDYLHYHQNGGILPNFANNILMLHDVLPLILDRNPLRNLAYKRYTKSQIKLAQTILTPSLYSKTQILRYFKVDKEIHVLPHGVEKVEAPSKTKGDYYIYVGGYDPRKGLDNLLETFIRLKKKIIFVGEIRYFSRHFEALAKRAMSLGISTQSGYVSEIRLRELIKNAKALIYPSKFEGFGLPPLESMALGTPVITTPFSSIKEICKECALYFDPDIKDSLYKTIISFESSDIKEKLIKAGLENAKDYSWEKTAREYMGILHELQNTRKSHNPHK